MAYPGPYTWLGWICMTPWLITVKRSRPLSGFILGLAYGALYILPYKINGIFNAVSSLNPPYHMEYAISAVFYSPYILPFAIFGIYKSYQKNESTRGIITDAALLMLLIYLFPKIFPVTPALVLHNQPVMIQLADIGGVPLILFLQIMINFLFADLLCELWNKKLRLKTVSMLAGIFICILSYGLHRMHIFEGGQNDENGVSVEILAVQPNLPLSAGISGLIRDNKRYVFSALEMSRKGIGEHPSTELIVWPEAHANASCDPNGPVMKKLEQVSKELGKAFIFHCNDTIDEEHQYNVAAMVRPDGVVETEYRKRGLIPIFESDFFRFAVFGDSKDYFKVIPGKKPVSYNIGANVKVAPFVCYDIHFQELVRKSVINGGEILLHMSNERLFDDLMISYSDHAMAVFRAVEFKKPMVRVTNTGFGAFVSPTGELLGDGITPFGKKGAYWYKVAPNKTKTFYCRFGDVILYLMIIWLIMDLFCTHYWNKII